MSAMRKRLLTIVMLAAALMIFTVPALAAGTEDSAAMADATASSGKAIAAGIAIGLAAAGGAVVWVWPWPRAWTASPASRRRRENPHHSYAGPCVCGDGDYLRPVVSILIIFVI